MFVLQNQNNSTHENYTLKLKQCFGDNYFYDEGHHVLSFEYAANFNSIFENLKNKFDCYLCLDILCVDHLTNNLKSNYKFRFELVYHFLNLKKSQRVRVKILLNEKDILIPSIFKLWKTAKWYEREIWDMFGISFSGHDCQRLLTSKNFVGHPLRKDFKKSSTAFDPLLERKLKPILKINDNEANDYLSWVTLGPNWPGSRGALNLSFLLEGEFIVKSKVEIGLAHRGVEKLCENLNYTQIIPYAEKLNYSSPLLSGIAACHAIEALKGITLPDRAQALRMIFGEFSRIADHLMCTATICFEAEVFKTNQYCLQIREKILNFFHKISGNRFNFSYATIGGVGLDLRSQNIAACFDLVKSLHQDISQMEKFLSRSTIWMKNLNNCNISGKDAILWGFSGPCLRAAGINYDIRKAFPYYFYSDVDFEIPLGINGTAYDCYLVRVEEMKQSLRIIGQVLENLPSGVINLYDIKTLTAGLSLKDKISKTREILSHNANGPKEIYSSIEAANGELGFYFLSTGGDKPYRMKVRPPCFSLMQSFSEISQNNIIPDAMMMLSAMNIIVGEMDR